MVAVSAPDASILSMARKVRRATNQNAATGNTLQQQHARKDGRKILTIFIRSRQVWSRWLVMISQK